MLGYQILSTNSHPDQSVSLNSLSSPVPFCPTGPAYDYQETAELLQSDASIYSEDSDYTDNGSSSNYDTDNLREYPKSKQCPTRCYKKYQDLKNRYYCIQQAKLHNIIDPYQGDEHLVKSKTPSRHALNSLASQLHITYDAHI